MLSAGGNDGSTAHAKPHIALAWMEGWEGSKTGKGKGKGMRGFVVSNTQARDDVRATCARVPARARACVCQGNNLPPHNSTSPNATSLIVSVVLPSVAVIVDVICATMAGRLAIHRPSLDGSGAAEVATY